MNLIIIARHYSKLLLRTRLFQIYFLITFCGILYIQIHNQSNLPQYSPSGLASLASFIPYMNAYLFTLFQVIPLLFLTSAFLGKERKIDSMDAIFYRPESNTEYIWGMSLAFIVVFFVMGIISLVLAFLIHFFASDAPFSLRVYLFYLFTLILPSAIFTLGFSMLIVSWIRNRAISLIILLGSMFFFIFCTGDFQQGLLDPLGLTLPNAFSGITGHPNLIGYLLQRGCWLILGLGFIQWTVVNFSRIPNAPGRMKPLKWMLVCMIVGISSGCFFFFIHRVDLSLRREYISVYEKYATARHGALIQEDICYQQQGNKMVVQSCLTIQNKSPEELEKIILYLNPSLRIISIKSNGEKLLYRREHQVILVEKKLPVGQDIKILVYYEGEIDENVCYPDIPEKVFLATKDRSYMTCRYGKHYAFLDQDYTLLIPEALWYPVTIPPVNLQSPYNTARNFTRYTLKVINTGAKNIISQGERQIRGDTTTFQDKYPLPGISLCMGDYERRVITIDSLSYELNLFREHAFLLDNMKWLNNRYALLELLSDLNEEARRETGRDYPYDHFILTETPVTFASYFRDVQGGSEYVQPEIVFFTERGTGLWRDFKHMTTSILKRTFQKVFMNTKTVEELFSFHQFFGLPFRSISSLIVDVKMKGNPYSITPLFYNYTTSIESDEYPVMNQVLGLISLSIKDKERVKGPADKKLEIRATRYLAGNSLKDALVDDRLDVEERNEILRLKSNDLVSRFHERGINSDSLIRFVNTFLKDHKFQQVDFYRFNELFIEEFGVDGEPVLSLWFTQNRLPRFLIKDFSARDIKEMKKELGYPVTRIECSVFNDSQEDGIITIQTTEKGSAKISVGGGPEPVELSPTEYSYMIPAGKGQKIAFVQYKCPANIILNTNLSENIPSSKRIRSIDGIPNVSTSSFVREVDKNYFLDEQGEIIVDNEDSSFYIFQTSSRLKLQAYLNNLQAIEEKYGNLTSMMSANESWKFYVDESTFGRTILSAVLRKAGKGESRVEWNTAINKEGEYEVGVYLPNTSFAVNNGFFIAARERESLVNDAQVYLVSSGEGNKEIVINTFGQAGWISLGRFYFTPGDYKVSLSDKGQPGQVIVGDAVKWKYCDK